MSADFRRAGLIRREELLLVDDPGVSDAGRLIFLASEGGGDRVHRMDLARLRRFSIDRESRALRFTLLGVVGGLLLLLIAALGVALDPQERGWAVGLFLAVLLGFGAAVAVSLAQVRVGLTFEDATRTRSFVTWTSKKRLTRFEDRLRDAVSSAQAG